MNAYRYYILWQEELLHAYDLAYYAINDNFEEIKADMIQEMLAFMRYVEQQVALDATYHYSNAIAGADKSADETELNYGNGMGYGILSLKAMAYRARALDLYARLEAAGSRTSFLWSEDSIAELFQKESSELNELYNHTYDDYQLSCTYEQMPLLAQTDQIKLYSIPPEGVLLQANGQHAIFNWKEISTLILPVLSQYDYDEDGTKEIAIVFAAEAEANIQEMELHIIEYQEENGNFADYMLDATAAAALIKDNIHMSYDVIDALSFALNGKQIILTQTIRYDNGQGIEVIALLSAEVFYKNGAFTLSELQISQ